jgi:hypothetical protein
MDVSLDTEGVKSLVARITYPQSAVTTIRDWSRINPIQISKRVFPKK